jgi:diguanylate cyclase (GGDEF)-like protein
MSEKSVTPSFLEWLRLTNIADLSSNKLHSRDFNGSRSEYIYMRLRLLSLLFALLAILWIPVDVFFTPNEVLGKILGLRLTYSGLYLFLGLWSAQPQNLSYSRVRLAFFVLIPCVFYISSRMIFNDQTELQGALIGYSFLPYITVVLLAIFPLTLREGIVFSLIVGISFVFTEHHFGNLQSLSSLGDIWLLTLLAGISVWAQLSQLLMLLRLYREASRDALTGLVNRAVLNKWINPEINRVRENGQPLSAILIDLDFFKRVNDTYGHLTGDQVLMGFSALLKAQLAGFNLIGRYGGEEFLAILPEKNATAATELAERIRQRCHSQKTEASNGEIVNYTVSIGVSELHDDDTSNTLIDRADKGLYTAKMQGRDRVINTEIDS